MCSSAHIPKNQAGFTLIELIVGLGISAMALVALMGLFIGIQGKHYETRKAVTDMGDVRVALGLLAGEVRSAGSDAVERNIAGDGLLVATPDTLSLISDLDGDEVIEFTEPPEMVRYVYDPVQESLTRDTGDGPVQLVQNVSACEFVYRDAAGSRLIPGVAGATTLDVRTVQLRITINGGDGREETRQSTYMLRNR